MNFLIFLFLLQTYSISTESNKVYDSLNRKDKSGNFSYDNDHKIGKFVRNLKAWFG